jgi:hypothetical protein
MNPFFEQTLVDVWRQTLVENASVIELGFIFDGNEIRGLEQNPETKSRWAVLARSGKKVMQFLSGGIYIANVVDGKVNRYRRSLNEG